MHPRYGILGIRLCMHGSFHGTQTFEHDTTTEQRVNLMSYSPEALSPKPLNIKPSL